MRISDWSSDVCSSDLTKAFSELARCPADPYKIGCHKPGQPPCGKSRNPAAMDIAHHVGSPGFSKKGHHRDDDQQCLKAFAKEDAERAEKAGRRARPLGRECRLGFDKQPRHFGTFRLDLVDLAPLAECRTQVSHRPRSLLH